MSINKNFVVKNGIEVSDNLIYGDSITRKVGIGKTNPNYELDVSGAIGVNTVIINQKLSINGIIDINGNTGQNGQYLVNVGSGVSWSNTPGLRQLVSVTASQNQTSFPVTYNVSSGVDVFVNGARLSPSDYIANNGTSVEFYVPCFGGENIDFVSYSVFGTSPQTGNNASYSGIVTALGGFISVGNTTPVKISVTGNKLIFTVTGIGSTSFNLA